MNCCVLFIRTCPHSCKYNLLLQQNEHLLLSRRFIELNAKKISEVFGNTQNVKRLLSERTQKVSEGTQIRWENGWPNTQLYVGKALFLSSKPRGFPRVFPNHKTVMGTQKDCLLTTYVRLSCISFTLYSNSFISLLKD